MNCRAVPDLTPPNPACQTTPRPTSRRRALPALPKLMTPLVAQRYQTPPHNASPHQPHFTSPDATSQYLTPPRQPYLALRHLLLLTKPHLTCLTTPRLTISDSTPPQRAIPALLTYPARSCPNPRPFQLGSRQAHRQSRPV